jgi:hypothetical protein
MSIDTNSKSELYAIALDCNEPNNYTIVPNIIDHLTYDFVDEEGNITIRRLSVFAIQLYRIIRTIAGQEGICWRTAENLAELANMSEGQVSKCKKELMQKFHQLEGASLISIEEKEKTILKEGKKINGTIYHVIKLKNIWNYNRAFFLKKKWDKEQAGFPEKPVEQAGFPEKPVTERAGFPGECNNITYNNTPLFKEQHSADESDIVVSLDKKEDIVIPENRSYNEANLQAFNWFLKIGCNLKSAIHFVDNFSVDDIKNASLYVEKQIQKKKKNNSYIPNPIGYLRKTLENKYWLNPNEKTANE